MVPRIRSWGLALAGVGFLNVLPMALVMWRLIEPNEAFGPIFMILFVTGLIMFVVAVPLLFVSFIVSLATRVSE